MKSYDILKDFDNNIKKQVDEKVGINAEELHKKLGIPIMLAKIKLNVKPLN